MPLGKRGWLYVGLLLGILGGFIGDILLEAFIFRVPMDILGICAVIGVIVLALLAWLDNGN